MAYKSGNWARLLELVPRTVTLCIAVAAALAVVGRGRLWTALVAAHDEFGEKRGWKRYLVGHLVSWAALILITKILFERSFGSPAVSTALTVLWAVLAAGSMWLWALAILPARAWGRWCWNCRDFIATSVPLALIAWAAATLTAKLGWGFLSELTLASVHWVLSAAYSGLVFEPAQKVIGTPSFTVHVGTACAGYEGVGLLTAFTIGYLWLARRTLRFPQSFLLLPVGIVAIWLANVARIAMLIAIGSAGYPDIACGGFHSQAGWLAFNAITLALVAVSGRLKWFTARRTLLDAQAEPDATAAYLIPFLGIVATAMVTGAFSAGFDWLYGARVLVAIELLAYFSSAYRPMRWRFSWQGVALGMIAFGVWLALAPGGGSSGPPDELRTVSIGVAGLWLGLRMLGYVVTAPIAEELAFRGFLMRRFVSADFERVPISRFHWLGFAGSSLLFGFMHGGAWLAATAAGMLYALAAYRRGDLSEAIVAHSTTNALNAFYVLWSGDWQRLG